ncbi:MAG: hypothetical protein M1821_003628 [Bathelium mastoideum]|nr:MAG: hypothetical protein M1821_003628 [Bathelium mastoideum]KAI9684916.1 MAG: hypothetical protein M1822_005565 [Bathelium mastoideum]
MQRVSVYGMGRRLRSLQASTFALQARHGSSLSDSETHKFLSNPTWSVKSLLPCTRHHQAIGAVSSTQLHHLLRLSALPLPSSQDEEIIMLATLNTQLQFVREIQKVDTTGVKPLRSLRDETPQGQKESEVRLRDLKEAFDREEVRGKHHKRIRRRQQAPVDTQGAEDWNVLGYAERTVGKFFVVENTKERPS